MKINKRVISFSGVRVRDRDDGTAGRLIEGDAILFGVRSRLLCDWWNGTYYEVLEPGSITREMLDNQDIKLTIFHDRQLILGRSKQGKGTLRYTVTERGVHFECEMPRTADGDKALELVRRGDIDGCSFIYSTDEEDSERCVSFEKLQERTSDGNEILLRHVKRIDHVYDFTLTPDPAYEQTSVTKREYEAFEEQISNNNEDSIAQERDGSGGSNQQKTDIIIADSPCQEDAPPEIDLSVKRHLIASIRKRLSRTI